MKLIEVLWEQSIFARIIEVVTAAVAALTLSFNVSVYGYQPTSLDFECERITETAVLEQGDHIRFNITVTNTGKPFVGATCFVEHLNVYLYTTVDGKVYYISHHEFSDCAEYKGHLIKHGLIGTENDGFIIPDDAPEGSYTLCVQKEGIAEEFPDFITVV